MYEEMSSKEIPVSVMAEAGMGSDVARPFLRDFGGGLRGGSPLGRRGGTLERMGARGFDSGAVAGRAGAMVGSVDGLGSILISGFFSIFFSAAGAGVGIGFDSGIVGSRVGCEGRRRKPGVEGAECWGD